MDGTPGQVSDLVLIVILTSNAVQVIALAYIAYLARRYTNHR